MSSIYSAALEGFHLDLNAQEWKRQRFVNLILSAVLCLQSIGQVFIAIRILGRTIMTYESSRIIENSI